MNKVKMFFIAAAMLLTTAGVFAGKAKFNTLTLYVSSTGLAGSFTQISPSAAFTGLTTVNPGTQNQATIRDGIVSTVYGLYSAQSSTSPVYATGW